MSRRGTETPRIVSYLRVSTSDQDVALQRDAIARWVAAHGGTLTHEYVDHGVSGKIVDRPALAQLERAAKRREFDILVVYALDRVGRHLVHLVGFLQELQSLRIGIVSLREGHDSTTPAGLALMQMAAVFAEFERELMRERTIAGMQAAKARGVHIGRRSHRMRDSYDRAEVAAIVARTGSMNKAAKELKVSAWLVKQVLAGSAVPA